VTATETDGQSLQQRTLEIGDQPSSLRTYRALRFFIRQVLYRFFRVTIEGEHNLPGSGPVILAPVHRSNLDVLLVNAISERRVRSLAKQSMFMSRFGLWLFSALGAIPVERGTADREALRASQMLLDRGEPLMIFPEGTRQSGPNVGEVFDGTAYLSGKSNAPVVPIGFVGTEEALPSGSKRIRRSRVRIVIGEPISPERGDNGRVSRTQREEFSTRLRSTLQTLMDRAAAL